MSLPIADVAHVRSGARWLQPETSTTVISLITCANPGPSFGLGGAHAPGNVSWHGEYSDAALRWQQLIRQITAEAGVRDPSEVHTFGHLLEEFVELLVSNGVRLSPVKVHRANALVNAG